VLRTVVATEEPQSASFDVAWAADKEEARTPEESIIAVESVRFELRLAPVDSAEPMMRPEVETGTRLKVVRKHGPWRVVRGEAEDGPWSGWVRWSQISNSFRVIP